MHVCRYVCVYKTNFSKDLEANFESCFKLLPECEYQVLMEKV